MSFLFLETQAYPEIGNAMIQQNPGAYSAAVRFRGDTGPPAGLRMSHIPSSQIDFSLGRQLDQLTTSPPEGVPPQAYVFTATSAIPVADAVKGYYETREKALPLLTHINANSAYADARFHPTTRKVTEEGIKLSVANFKSEIVRLRDVLSGLGHVCIVEQYVSSGKTIQYAKEILRKSGVEQVTAIRGRWYHDAWPQEVDIDNLSSAHSGIMRHFGQQAAE